MRAIRQHAWAIMCAVAVAMIAGLPAVLAPQALGSEYRGVQYLPLDDEDIYRARIQEILDGHGGVASPMLYEYKDARTPYVPVNEWLYALPAFVLGLAAVVVASKFILPALLFLVAYLLVRQLVERDRAGAELTAIAAGLIVSLGSEFVNYGHMLTLFSGAPSAPIMWTRLVNPISGAVELFAFLLMLALLWHRRWKHAPLAAGALLALMVGYFFSFGLALAVLGMIFVIALWRGERGIVLRLAAVGAISVAFDAAWWYGMLHAYGGGDARAAAMRAGMSFTHAPILNKAVLAASVLFAAAFAYNRFFLRRQTDDLRGWAFPAALIGGSWIAFNQQVVTGRDVWHPHFMQYTVPLLVVALLVAGHRVVGRALPRVWMAAMILACILTVGYGAYSVSGYVSRTADFARQQAYADVFDWLRANAPADCVVYVAGDAHEELERLIPAYTSCNVYTTTVTFSGIPQERIMHNYLARLALAGVPTADIRRYLGLHEADIRTYFYADWQQMFGHGREPWITEREASLAAAYAEFARMPLEPALRRYRIDYIVAAQPLSEAVRRQLPGLRLVSTTGAFMFYAF